MAYVLAQTGLEAVLHNRPATATGLCGAALCGLLTLLLAHASTSTSSVDEGLDELPFVPGMTLALGSPEAAARVADPGVAPPSPPVEPAEPAEAAAIAAHMDGSCAKIRHTFSWTVDSAR